MEARRDRRWAALLAVLVLLVVGGTAWLVLGERARRASGETSVEEPDAVPDEAAERRRRRAGDPAAEAAGTVAGARDEAAGEAEPMPRICRLDVRVVAAEGGAPIASADVAYEAPDGTRDRAEADADGRVVFRDVPWSKAHVQVRAPGFETADQDVRTLPLGGRLAVRIELREAWPLRVVVRDAWTRAAVPGARVEAFRRSGDPWPDGGRPGALVFEGTCAGDGRLTVPRVAGSCLLRVSGDGLETTWTSVSRSGPDDGEVVAWTSPGGAVHGRVSDASGSPAAGVTLRVSWGRSSDGPGPLTFAFPNLPYVANAPAEVSAVWRPFTNVTDASGRYRIEGLPRGPPFLLRAHDAEGGAMTESVRLRLGRADAEIEHDLVVDRPAVAEGIDVEYVFPDTGSEVGDASVRGSVTDAAGEPLGDVRVWIAGATHATYSEPDGRFEIRGVVPGPCEVRTDNAHEQASVETTAPADGLLLTLATGAAPEGDGGGTPRVRFVAVLVGDGPAPPSLFVRARSSMTTLPWPAGARRAELEYAVFTGGTTPRSLRIEGPGLRRVTVDVPPGGGVRDLGEVRLDTGLVLRGTVVDDAGTPVPDAMVSVRAPDDDWGSWARSDASGRFVASGLEEGEHTVASASARHASREAVTVKVGPASPDVVLVLDRKVPLRVVVRDEDGLPIEGALVLVAGLGPTETDRSGAADLWLDAGSHAIRAREPVLNRETSPRNVELQQGDARTEVVLEIPRGVR